MNKIIVLFAITLVTLAVQLQVNAGIRNNVGFTTNTLARNDDGSTGFVSFGFSGDVNFFGMMRSGGFVNNNGNMTLDSALSTFTPFPLDTTAREILAPFFADVDSRSWGDEVTYGTDTVGGRDAFGVNWLDADYYFSDPAHGTQLNNFQLVVIERFDTGAGNFDFEFNYGSILWETGDASGGTGGLGGDSARVGWANGGTDTFELPGSAVNGAFLDGGPEALNGQMLLFQVRNGVVGDVPEPTSLIIWGCGLGVGLVLTNRRRRQRD